jgi:hypothetical protein
MSSNHKSTDDRARSQRSLPENTSQAPYHVWAGHGQGMPCDRCKRPIEKQEVEYEVEWEAQPQTESLHFHRLCYQEWEVEKAGTDRPLRRRNTTAVLK